MGGEQSKEQRPKPTKKDDHDNVQLSSGRVEALYAMALRDQAASKARGGDEDECPVMKNGRGRIYNPLTGKWKDLPEPVKAHSSSGGGGGVPKFAVKTFPSGNKYEGEWLDGKYHGQGTLKYADGRKYEGGWHEGACHGKGHFHYANGDQYVGDYFVCYFVDTHDGVCRVQAGQQQGHGRFVWGNGDVYVGAWKNGKRHGKGKLSKRNGDGFDGMWKDGHPDMQIFKNVHR